MKYTHQIILVVVTAITSALITATVGVIYVTLNVYQPFTKEAVDRGFANWEVVDNSTGKTEFTWNEFAYAVHPDNPNTFFDEIEKPLGE